MTNQNNKPHRCDPSERWEMLDARGISCGFVCSKCEAEKRRQYRPEIFNDPGYYADEPIEPEPGVVPDDVLDACREEPGEYDDVPKEFRDLVEEKGAAVGLRLVIYSAVKMYATALHNAADTGEKIVEIFEMSLHDPEMLAALKAHNAESRRLFEILRPTKILDKIKVEKRADFVREEPPEYLAKLDDAEMTLGIFAEMVHEIERGLPPDERREKLRREFESIDFFGFRIACKDALGDETVSPEISERRLAVVNHEGIDKIEDAAISVLQAAQELRAALAAAGIVSPEIDVGISEPEPPEYRAGTNIDDEARRLFESLRDPDFENFALFSCFEHGEPTTAIVSVHRDGEDFVIVPHFVGVHRGMYIEDHDGEPPRVAEPPPMYRDSQHGLTIDLSGPDGNAHALIGYASRYARDLDKDREKIIADMMSGDYENLLSVFEREFGSVITLINKPGEKRCVECDELFDDADGDTCATCADWLVEEPRVEETVPPDYVAKKDEIVIEAPDGRKIRLRPGKHFEIKDGELRVDPFSLGKEVREALKEIRGFRVERDGPRSSKHNNGENKLALVPDEFAAMTDDDLWRKLKDATPVGKLGAAVFYDCDDLLAFLFEDGEVFAIDDRHFERDGPHVRIDLESLPDEFREKLNLRDEVKEPAAPKYVEDEATIPEHLRASRLYVRKPSGRYRVAEPGEIVEHALAATEIKRDDKITSPKDTRTFLALKLGHLEHESFAVVFLDNRHRVIDFLELFRGTIDGTAVYPREVVKEALKRNAAAIILAHNHPSGIAEPSQADERITKRLKSALELIDVRLLDHLIVGGGGANTTSLAERGVL